MNNQSSNTANRPLLPPLPNKRHRERRRTPLPMPQNGLPPPTHLVRPADQVEVVRGQKLGDHVVPEEVRYPPGVARPPLQARVGVGPACVGVWVDGWVGGWVVDCCVDGCSEDEDEERVCIPSPFLSQRARQARGKRRMWSSSESQTGKGTGRRKEKCVGAP